MLFEQQIYQISQERVFAYMRSLADYGAKHEMQRLEDSRTVSCLYGSDPFRHRDYRCVSHPR